jgi:hypothetical protein
MKLLTILLLAAFFALFASYWYLLFTWNGLAGAG